MKKVFVYTIGSAVLAGVTGILYARRQKSANEAFKATSIEQAGIPDQIYEHEIPQLENAKKVSEGSRFGVQYYNKARDEQEEILP